MDETRLERVVACLKALDSARQIAIVDDLSNLIADTGQRAVGSDELAMEALSRRSYYIALKLGGDKKAKAKNSKSGVPTPQYGTLTNELKKFRGSIGLTELFHEPSGKDVEHFCTMKVRNRGSSKRGFYLLCALYILEKDDSGSFAEPFYAGLVLTKDALSHSIWLFLTQRLNLEAERHGQPPPFAGVRPARAPSKYRAKQRSFLVHDHHLDKMIDIFGRYRSPEDGNAHLAVYRLRQSQPDEVMKSFLVWMPGPESGPAADLSSLHIYRAPKREGGTVRSSPGKVIPLEAGLFVLGGQRPDPMRTGASDERPVPVPFRSLELLFFPWSSFQGSHLYPGLILSANDKGLPLVGFICARPLLFSEHGQAGIGAIPATGLAASLETDRLGEIDLANKREKPEEEVARINEIYNEYESVAGLANRILARCNNSSKGWKVSPRFKRNGRNLRRLDIEQMLESTFEDVLQNGDSGQAFDLFSHLFFAPLRHD